MNDDLQTLGTPSGMDSPLKCTTEEIIQEEKPAEKKIDKQKEKGRNTKWEFNVDKNKKYHTVEKKVLVRGYGELEILEVCNLKKEYNKEAFLLIRYNSGQREWCTIEPCLEECPDLVTEYLKENKLTLDKLGYTGSYCTKTSVNDK